MPEWLSSRLPAGWSGWEVVALTVTLAVGSAVVRLMPVAVIRSGIVALILLATTDRACS